MWNDGTPLDFTAWNPGEPNNDGDNEDCVHLWTNAGALWNDIPCTGSGVYIRGLCASRTCTGGNFISLSQPAPPSELSQLHSAVFATVVAAAALMATAICLCRGRRKTDAEEEFVPIVVAG